MSDDTAVNEHRTPGQQIRLAREAAGLHIVALAAALKVPVRKLEALEADRWTDLTDPTFTRALASSVARHLKLDPTAVLVGLPSNQPDSLDLPAGLGQAAGGGSASAGRFKPSPVVWGALGLLVLAGGVYLAPAAWLTLPQQESQVVASSAVDLNPSKSSDAAGTPMGVASNGQEKADSEPTAQPSAAAPPIAIPAHSGSESSAKSVPAAPSAPGAAGAVVGGGGGTRLQLLLKGASWVEVTDSVGKLRLQRIATAGETLQFDDAPSYAVVLGNAAVVEVQVNGQSKDLSDLTRNNVARFQAN